MFTISFDNFNDTGNDLGIESMYIKPNIEHPSRKKTYKTSLSNMSSPILDEKDQINAGSNNGLTKSSKNVQPTHNKKRFDDITSLSVNIMNKLKDKDKGSPILNHHISTGALSHPLRARKHIIAQNHYVSNNEPEIHSTTHLHDVERKILSINYSFIYVELNLDIF